MTASRTKGKAFERTIANTLSQRFAEATGLTGAFRRATDSGAYFGKSNSKRLLSTGTEHACFGDILCPRNFRFTIECKNYAETPPLSHFAKQSSPRLDSWLAQADDDAENAGKVPALIVKWHHCPAIVFLPSGYNLDPFLVYRNRIALTLDAWLKEPDEHFFTEVAW